MFQKVRWQPITSLPIIARHIDQLKEQQTIQHQKLVEARQHHPFNPLSGQRISMASQQIKVDLLLEEKQINRWNLDKQLTKEQQQEIRRLKDQVQSIYTLLDDIMALVQEAEKEIVHFSLTREEGISTAQYLTQLEEATVKAAQQMVNAIFFQHPSQFQAAAEKWRLAQEAWLVTSQDISPQQAHLVMMNFATKELAQWQKEATPGVLPPSVFSQFEHQQE